ncbi:hypothetical protein HU200_025322 [Digitaria exilis]|uniref:Uncharacterized protein n=1 Tax=Digitaria exilis TaxID=1010633 RepID=A0A835C583_9POAL|nr:hypothetical protein HU200_025322 [Digitaria exilis]
MPPFILGRCQERVVMFYVMTKGSQLQHRQGDIITWKMP